MAKIIGASGAQGTGKTTTLVHLESLGVPSIKIGEILSSRTVQKEMNKTLDEIWASPELSMEFQDKVLDRQVHSVKALAAQDDDKTRIFVDRTPADMYAYARIQAEKNGLPLTWLRNYCDRCRIAMHDYACTLFLPIGVIPFVSEAQRAKEESQRKHHEYCLQFITAHARKWRRIAQTTVAGRAAEFLRATDFTVM